MSDRLDRMLRGHARSEIPDDGFTARTMGALPAFAPRSRPAWPALVWGSAVAGSVLAVALAPGDTSIAQGFADLARLRIFTPAAVAGLAMAAALLVSALVLAAEAD
jgi:hypothetical protein